jgi:hypothetical protein
VHVGQILIPEQFIAGDHNFTVLVLFFAPQSAKNPGNFILFDFR